METKKYHIDKDEWWPMIELTDLDDPLAHCAGSIVELPVDLVEKYQDACAKVHSLNNELLNNYYPD